MNNFQYICETVFHDLLIDDKNKDLYVLKILHCQKNLTYESLMEIPY